MSWSDTEKNKLRRENEELKRKLETQTYRATVFADLAWEARYEAMRKLADTSDAWEMLSSVNNRLYWLRFRLLYQPAQTLVDLDDALALIDKIGRQVKEEKESALAEYRRLKADA